MNIFQSQDPVVQSIFDRYCHDSYDSLHTSSAWSSRSMICVDEQEEDVVLAAIAVLDEDYKETRGLPSQENNTQELGEQEPCDDTLESCAGKDSSSKRK